MVLEKLQDKFTKYEIARILGARSLQLAMDAPILMKLTKEEEEELNFDTLRIAEKELEANVLPITVRRPLPKKSGKIIKKLTEEEIKEKLEKEEKEKKVEEEKPEVSTEEVGDEEETAAKPATSSGEAEDEMMEMATPEDESSGDEGGEDSGEEI